jgi:hypothetical protein
MDVASRNFPSSVIKSSGSSPSREDNSTILNDILHQVECLDDDVVYEKLDNKHSNFRQFLYVLTLCTPQVFFATERGFVGNASGDVNQDWQGTFGHNAARFYDSHSVLKDDVAVVPRGVSMPWVLRKIDVDGEYKLIIDCFVHGIMEGELMALVESGQLQTQTFTLV